MYCKFCGQQIDDNAQFCPYCGRQLEKSNGVRIKQGHNKKKGRGRRPRKKWPWLVFFALILTVMAVFILARRGKNEKNTEVADRTDDFIISYERKEELHDTSKGPEVFDLYDMGLEASNESTVISVLADYASYFGISHCIEELEFLEERSVLSDTCFRFQQYYHEIPVYGKEVIVTESNGQIVSLINNTVFIENAVTSVDDYSVQVICDSLNIDTNRFGELCKLYLYELDGEFTTVYVLNTDTGEHVIADANTGMIICRSSSIKYGEDVRLELQGQVEKRVVDATKEDNYYNLIDNKREIYVYDLSKNNEYLSYEEKLNKGTLISFKNEKNCKNKSAVDALFNIERAYDFYDKELGHKAPDGNGKTYIRIFDGFDEYIKADGTKSRYFNNAFSWGRPDYGRTEIAISPRKGTTYANDLDVLGHEYTHSVISYVMGDNDAAFMNPEGDALNEGIADIMGLMIEAYYSNNQCDWNVGDVRDYGNDQLKQNYNEYSEYDEEHEGGPIICNVARRMWNGNPKTSEAGSIQDPVLMAELWYRAIMMLNLDFDFTQCRSLVELNALNMYREGRLSKSQYECVLYAFDESEIKYRINSGIGNLFDFLGIFRNAYPSNTDIYVIVNDYNDNPTNEYNARIINSKKQVVGEFKGEPIALSLPYGNYTIEIMGKDNDLVVYRGLLKIRDFPESVRDYFITNEMNIITLNTELGIAMSNIGGDVKWGESSYSEVIDALENEYGPLELNVYESDSDHDEQTAEADGLCYLELRDFNNDGVEELLAVAKHENDPEYTVMVFTEENGQAVKLLSSTKLTDASWPGDYLFLLCDNNHTYIDRKQWGGEWDYDEIYGYDNNGFKLISISCRRYNFNKDPAGWDYYIADEVPEEVVGYSPIGRLVSFDVYKKEAPLATGACGIEPDYICFRASDVGSDNFYSLDIEALEASIDKVKEELDH